MESRLKRGMKSMLAAVAAAHLCAGVAGAAVLALGSAARMTPSAPLAVFGAPALSGLGSAAAMAPALAPSLASPLAGLTAAPFAAPVAAPAAVMAAPIAAPTSLAAAPLTSRAAAALKIGAINSDIQKSIETIGARGSSAEALRRSGGDIGARLQDQKLVGAGVVDLPLSPAVAKPGGALLPAEQNDVNVFKTAAPSTVFIHNLKFQRKDYYEDATAVPQGLGSGYVWDKNGYIVTNFHVVNGGDAFLVTLQDGTKLDGKFIGGDPVKDIAVLKVSKALDKLVPIKLGDSDNVQVGQRAIAIGTPLGLSHSMSAGIVSAVREMPLDDRGNLRKVIQTDAAINPGNSGGPLLDSSARLIGMNTFILKGGGGGLGFAVPVNTIKQTVPALIKKGGVVEQAAIGIAVVDEERRQQSGIDAPGVIIEGVFRGSPAAEAGLRGLSERGGLGDVIVGIDGASVNTFEDLAQALSRHEPGDIVSLKVRRGDRVGTVKVRLTAFHESGLADAARSSGAQVVSQKVKKSRSGR